MLQIGVISYRGIQSDIPFNTQLLHADRHVPAALFTQHGVKHRLHYLDGLLHFRRALCVIGESQREAGISDR